jgi:hypothetical protein
LIIEERKPRTRSWMVFYDDADRAGAAKSKMARRSNANLMEN